MIAEILNMPAAEYHARKALSNTGITKLLDCPARFKLWLDGEQDDQTEAMLIGSAFHCLVLEPNEFLSRYHVAKHPGNTSLGKEERSAAIAECRAVLTQNQYTEVEALANGIRRHKGISRLLSEKKRRTEASIFWDEELNGVTIPCKARLDLVLDWPDFGILILDLKSMKSLSPSTLPRTLMDRGYYRQGWWYMRALVKAGIDPRGFYLAAVEKSPPWMAALIEPESAAIEQGGRECVKALQSYADCAKSGTWPGYPETVIKVDLPDWFYRKEMNNETAGQFAE